MSNYFCNCCNYDAKVKSSFDKHLKTKKHQNNVAKFSQNLAKISQNLAKISPNLAENFHDSDKRPIHVEMVRTKCQPNNWHRQNANQSVMPFCPTTINVV